VTLPTASGIKGRQYVIKNSGTGEITVGTTSSQKIDAVTSWTLEQWDVLRIVSAGTSWNVI